MTPRIRTAVGLLTAIITISATTSGHTADARLDDAQAHLVKARELVKAAEPPSSQREFVRHVKRAQDLIAQAIREIDLAKNAANRAPTMELPSGGRATTLNPSGLIQLNPQPEPP